MRSRMHALALGAFVAALFAVTGAAQQPGGEKSQKDQKAEKNQPGSPRFDGARFLKDHDKNNDGKLSKDELPAGAQNGFARIDANKDGFVSQDELQKHAEAMADERPMLIEVVWYAIDLATEPPAPDELQEAYDQLRKIDKNNNGKIEEQELKACRQQRMKERVDGIFTALDKNNDSKVSKDEARGLWGDDFAELDKNKDGMLDRQEVETACMKRREDKPGAAHPSKQ